MRLVRRFSGVQRVGHAGTLDPAADGVLPVCLGAATRLIEYLGDTRKTYCAQIVLGITTTTDDVEGEVLAVRPVPSDLSVADIERALGRFRGIFAQRPPAFSALKQAGRPLYDLARQGVPVTVAPRWAITYDITCCRYEPPALLLAVECGRGFYVRSLARELGEALGCGAYLHNLRRIQDGPFTAEAALNLEDVALAFHYGYAAELLAPPDSVLAGWPTLIVQAEDARRICQGQAVPRQHPSLRARVYDAAGRFLAVVRGYGDRWQPEKVFVTPHDL